MAILDKLLESLKDYTSKLDEANNVDLDSWFNLFAILHLLQVQAQSFIDLVQTLLSNMGISSQGYRDSIRKLYEKNLITAEERDFLISVVGFRNIIVHEYATVNPIFVKKIMENKEYRRLLEIAYNLREKAKNYWDC
ncbi:MAG: HepT-like ribonuclease domain-containing protein [Acidianus hospitalis]